MSQGAIGDFATWTEPETAFQVQYSLPVFHEIDFLVTEGYRRIPHGGIEIGGLLFGSRSAGGARIEAFRPIQCEHALGPSFKLSERDIAGLRDQIARVDHDPELGGFETLGWFIAHTRGPLALTHTETRLFDELLPGPGMLTVLIKPEKFKPTLFAFLVRGRDGEIKIDGTDRAIILPLPGEPITFQPEPAAAASPEKVSPAMPVQAPAPPSRGELEPEPQRQPEAAVPPKRKPQPLPPPVPDSQPAPELPPKPERAPVTQPFLGFTAPPASPPVDSPPPPAEPSQPQPDKPAEPAPLAISAPQPEPWFDNALPEKHPISSGYPPSAGRTVARESKPEGNRSGMLFILIALAAFLGAGAGYWVYQQMSPTIIQLTVEPQPNGLVVSWAPEQTSSASRAFIQVNDGSPIELPAEARAAGRWQVQAAADNVKVELIAQHTLKRSVGIVRYIQPASGP